MLGSQLGQVVIANAVTQILLRQASQAADVVADMFGLNAGEARLLLGARRGEGLLLSGTHRVSFQAVASKKEHRLCIDFSRVRINSRRFLAELRTGWAVGGR